MALDDDFVDPIDPTGVLAELAATVSSARPIDAILDDVVALTKRRVPGVEEASITLIRHRKASTVAFTGELAIALDEIQYEEGYGPCLDAGRANEVMHIEDAAREKRWPRYVPTARKHGLGSSLSVPLPVENYLIGAVNMYSTRPHAFDRDSVTLAQAFAAHVTVALSQAEASSGHRRQVENLQIALQSRAVIEQAKGIIMAQRKCDAETAFKMLRDLSMQENVKLYELAAQVVTSASNHPVPRH
jgi:GAF domain-containing protein